MLSRPLNYIFVVTRDCNSVSKKNEMHGVRYKNWKLYFPHTYRSLNGRMGGMDGYKIEYDYDK